MNARLRLPGPQVAQHLREIDRVLGNIRAIHLVVVAGVDEGLRVVDRHGRDARDHRVFRHAIVVGDVAVGRVDQRLRLAVDRDRRQQVGERLAGEDVLVARNVLGRGRVIDQPRQVRRVAADDVDDVADAAALDEHAVHRDVHLEHRRALVGHVVDAVAEFLRRPDVRPQPHIAVAAVHRLRRQREHAILRQVHALHADVVLERDLPGQRRAGVIRVGGEDADRGLRRAAGIDGTVVQRGLQDVAAVIGPARRHVQVLAVVAHGVEFVDVLLLRVGAGEVALRTAVGRRACGECLGRRRTGVDRGEAGLERVFQFARAGDLFQEALSDGVIRA